MLRDRLSVPGAKSDCLAKQQYKEIARAVSFIFTFLFTLSACTSTAKKVALLDVASSNPLELQNLCDDGLSGACALQGKNVMLRQEVPIMQGVTSNTQSRFAVVVPKKEKFLYFARNGKNVVRLQAGRIWRDNSPMAVDQVEAFDLDPKETYELIVIDSRGMTADRRLFRALDLAKKRARVAVISCMNDELKTEQLGMWKALLSDNPDVILMIGDNVYADRVPNKMPTGEQIWDRYVDTRWALAFFKSSVLIPVVATWDDHDYGRNDSDRTSSVKEEARDVFHAFFPQLKPAPAFARAHGVGSSWSAFGLNLALLDNRTYRSPNRTNLPDETHFGPEQEDWIEDFLSGSQQPAMLVSGDQFFGGYHSFESYEGNHPKSFKAQLARWKKKAKTPVLFISGDRHLSEIIQVPRQALGHATYEITSSPLHARVFPEAFAREPSPRQLAGIAGQYNYVLLDILKASPKLLQLDVHSKGLEKKTLFQKTITVKR